MKKSVIIRFAIIGLLWLGFVAIYLARVMAAPGQAEPFMVVFTLVASAVIVFVPMYKKYVKKSGGSDASTK